MTRSSLSRAVATAAAILALAGCAGSGSDARDGAVELRTLRVSEAGAERERAQ
jgi:hypothetical protein